MVYTRSPWKFQMHLFSTKILRNGALVALALLSLALGGCLSSKRPLFNEKMAVTALGDGGRYQTYEATDIGTYKTEEKMNVRRTGQIYEFVNSRGISTSVSFYPLTDGRFAGQILTGSDDYAYVLMHKDGSAIYMHAAQCEKQDKEKLAALGVTFRDRQCMLDNVTDTQALFATLDFGEPNSKMEPDTGKEKSARGKSGKFRHHLRRRHRG